MLNRLRADIRAVKERDPAARNSVEILLLYYVYIINIYNSYLPNLMLVNEQFSFCRLKI